METSGSSVQEWPTTTSVTSSILALSKNGSRDARAPGGGPARGAGACSVLIGSRGSGTGRHADCPPARGRRNGGRSAAGGRLLDSRLSAHARRTARPRSASGSRRTPCSSRGHGRHRGGAADPDVRRAPGSRAGGRCRAAASTTARTRATRCGARCTRRPACTSSRAGCSTCTRRTSPAPARDGLVEDYHGVHLIFGAERAAASPTGSSRTSSRSAAPPTRPPGCPARGRARARPARRCAIRAHRRVDGSPTRLRAWSTPAAPRPCSPTAPRSSSSAPAPPTRSGSTSRRTASGGCW